MEYPQGTPSAGRPGWRSCLHRERRHCRSSLNLWIVARGGVAGADGLAVIAALMMVSAKSHRALRYRRRPDCRFDATERADGIVPSVDHPWVSAGTELQHFATEAVMLEEFPVSRCHLDGRNLVVPASFEPGSITGRAPRVSLQITVPVHRDFAADVGIIEHLEDPPVHEVDL